MTTPTNRKGRPSKPYRMADGTQVHGLYRLPDGRWRVVATGQKYTEHDERLAVAKFLAMQPAPPTVTIPIEGTETTRAEIDARLQLAILDPAGLLADPAAMALVQAVGGSATSSVGPDGKIVLSHKVGESAIWAWMREQLILHPDVVARMTGIPQVANLATMPMPRPSLPLAGLLDAYLTHNASKPMTKDQTKLAWKRFVKHTAASVLADVTTEKLMAYRQSIESTIPSPNTRKNHYAKIKTVFGFGLKVGLDPAQIRGVLDRAKVLWTSERAPAPKPSPVTREEFHALLAATEQQPWQPWRVWMLVGLNFAMHIGEVCGLKWSEIDLEAGTYCSIRAKTEAHRIPRAATIWAETLEALKALPRTSEYVFTSQHGTAFNRNKRVATFKDFRVAVGMDTLTFDSLRDGAYSAACRLCPDERWARLLAGHRSPGLQDSYVLRNPKIVKPACDAVHKAYFGK